EVSTDKVDSDVEAPTSGTLLSISVAEGETVAVGETVAIMSGGVEGDEAEQPPAPAAQPQTPPATTNGPPASEPVRAEVPEPATVRPNRATEPGRMRVTTNRFPPLPPRPAARVASAPAPT